MTFSNTVTINQVSSCIVIPGHSVSLAGIWLMPQDQGSFPVVFTKGVSS